MSWNSGDLYAVAWSPDQKTLAVARDERIDFWNIKDGNLAKEIAISGFSVSLSWSPDGREIASAEGYSGPDAAIRIWNTQTGMLVKTFLGHINVVDSVSWSPDGTKLVSSSSDHTVKVWDVLTDQNLSTYNGNDFIFLQLGVHLVTVLPTQM